MRTRAVVALALVLLAIATGALAAPPKSARFTLDGVEYLYITGVNFTDTAVLEPAGNASSQLPISSCAFVMLHPGTPNGRIVVKSLQEGGVPAELYIDQFRLPDGRRGYAYDSTVDEDGLTRLADVAVSGNVTLRIGADKYYDPVSSTGIDLIDKDTPDMLGTMRVLSAGVRDDVTGAVLGGDLVDDAELHIHMRGNPDAQPQPLVWTFDSPRTPSPSSPQPGGVPVPDVPVPTTQYPIPPTEAFGAAYPFPNLKFGGEATLAITTTAQAPAGMNELRFAVQSPTGDLVANVTLAPALMQDDDATLTFPLTLFGDYKLVVSGKVALATYSATLTMTPPPALDLHMWWENVTYGHQAYLDYRACEETLQSPNKAEAVEAVVGRPPPPQFKLIYVAFGAGGLVGAVAIVVKLASDQVSLTAFRKGK